MKNLKKNIWIIIVLSIAVTFVIVKNDFAGITNKLVNLHWGWFSLAIISMLLSILFTALSLKKLVRKFNPGYTLREALTSTWVVNFMSSITPANAGAPPAAIYTLKQQGLKTNEATHIGILFLTIYKVAFIAITTIAILSNFFFDFFKGDLLSSWLVTASYWITVGLLVILALITYNSKVNKWLFTKGIKLLSRMKIIKDREATTHQWHGYIDEFIKCGVYLKKDKKRVAISIGYYILSVATFMLIPYFCIKGVNPNVDLHIFVAIVISCYVCLIATVVPIPGSSGGTEMAYFFFYIKFVSGSTILATSLLLYRLLTYHLVVLIGGIVFIGMERKLNHANQDK